MSEPIDNEEDLGEPVSELRLLSEPSPDGFFSRVRDSIGRRLLVGDVVDFGIPVMLATMMEYIAVLFSVFGVSGPEQEEKEDHERHK